MVNPTRMGATRLIMRINTAMVNRIVATVGLTALLWLLCTLTVPGPVQAAVFFDTDFETCAVGTHNDFPCEGWDDLIAPGGHNAEWADGADDNTLEITNSPVFTGSKSVKETFRWITQDDGVNKPSIYHAVPRTDHTFTRFALRRDPTFQTCPFNNSTKMFRLRGEGVDGGYPVIMIINQSLSLRIGIEHGFGMGTVVYSGGPQISATAWQQVELEVKFNTPGVSDGIIRLWVDGTLYIEQLNLQLRGPTPTSRNSSNVLTASTYNFNQVQIYAQCGSGTLYWDRLAFGNTRIGPAQSRLSSVDSAPPARPTLNPIP